MILGMIFWRVISVVVCFLGICVVTHKVDWDNLVGATLIVASMAMLDSAVITERIQR